VKPRYFRLVAVLALSLTLALPTAQAGAVRIPPRLEAVTSAITGGALFGGTVPLLAEQGNLGRKLAIVRIYDMIGQKFKTPKIDQIMSARGTVLASLDIPHGRGITYASIAAGRQDTQIRAWLTGAEQEAVAHNIPVVYVSFEHEANTTANHVLGTPAQFRAAWNHMHRLAARAPLNTGTGGRLRWAIILMHTAYFPASMRPHWSLRLGFASQYFPGAGSVDVIAADGYNRGGCRKHKGSMPTEAAVTPGSLFNPVLTFARTHGGLPVFIAEWGSAFYSGAPAWQANFIPKMKAYVQANPSIAAVLYWDNRGYFGCDFRVDGHPLSVAALAAMGRAINGHLQG
jgi:hypothetical protein